MRRGEVVELNNEQAKGPKGREIKEDIIAMVGASCAILCEDEMMMKFAIGFLFDICV